MAEATMATVNGLADERQHSFRLAVRTDDGTSDWSNVATATPNDAPDGTLSTVAITAVVTSGARCDSRRPIGSHLGMGVH